MDAPGAVPAHKAHRPSRTKKKTNSGTGGKKQAVAKPGAFARRVRLAADRSEKRAANPAAPVDRTRGDAAPRVCAVVGPSGVGKSSIIRNLVKHYSKRNIPSVTGPITLVSGCKKRLTLIEVGPHLASMIDAAKVADMVLLVIDAGFGFEMETFELLNILAAHGMPKVITVLTHLDKLKDGRQVRKAKKVFKDRIWAELYDGAKVFYLSGITTTGDYLSREVLNLARFISVSKFPVLRWRAEHPYILADRIEDITPKSLPDTANRTVAAYGYVRGTPLRPAGGEWRLHLAGVADLIARNIEPLADPCPPPQSAAQAATSGGENGQKKRRKVTERERILYAPMAPEVDGIAYDRDAVYIDLNPQNIRFSEKSALLQDAGQNAEDDQDDGEESSDGEGEIMVKTLQKSDLTTVDDNLKRAELQLVAGGKPLISENFESRERRPADFDGHRDDDVAKSPTTDVTTESSDEEDDASESEDDQDNVDVSSKKVEVVGSSNPKKTGNETKRNIPSHEDESDDDGDDDNYDESEVESEVESERIVDGDVYDDDEGEDDDADSDDDDGGGDDDDDDDNDNNDDNDDNDDDDDGHEDDDEKLEVYDIERDNPDDYASKRWRDLMHKNAESNFKSAVSTSKALAKFVYDKDENGEYASLKKPDDINEGKSENDEDNDEDTFFRPKRRKANLSSGSDLYSLSDAILDDISRILPENVRDWTSNESLCTRLKRKRWGTGQMNDGNGNESAEPNNVDDDQEEVDGDFEDLETGEVHKADEEAIDDDGNGSDLDAIQAEKVRRKEQFDAEWDQNGRRRRKGGKDNDDDDDDRNGGSNQAPDVRSRKAMRGVVEREPDFRKLERERVEKLKEEELGNMDAESRVALEGMLPGQYVRLELKDVPVEFVKYFNPNNPLVLGGLRQGDDEGETFVRTRIRRNRFKRGVLKSNDPVIFSIGWRRFQSIPVYDMEDVNGRRRFVKYTPEHLHCNATFWGANVAPGAGVVMCQSLGREQGGFRISASGVVTEVDAAMNIVKKLKLVGEPVRVHRNTAFIKGLFNSELEASKYIGAAIRTVSGIRGTIKKTISETAQRAALDRQVAKAPGGTVRAGFEDKILLSDIVFLRAWVQVDVKQFCNIAATLLEHRQRDEKVASGSTIADDGGNNGLAGSAIWRMRTVREVRRQEGLAIPLDKDSLYREVERGTPVFAPLRVPKALEGALPYASKQKNFANQSHNKKAQRRSDQTAPKAGGVSAAAAGRKAEIRQQRAVVSNIGERKERQLLQAVYQIRKEKNIKKKEVKDRKLKEKMRELKRVQDKHDKTARETKKRKFALDGAKESRNSKRARGEDDRGGGGGGGDAGDD